MNGDWLALGAAGLLAAASGIRRGSRSAWAGPSPEMQRAAKALRHALPVSDVRMSRHTIYLLGTQKRLERLLTVTDDETGHVLRTSRWELGALLRAAKVNPGTAESYVENATHWEGLFSVIKLFVTETTGSDGWTVQVVPSPGSPQEATWSAKTGKIVKALKVEPFRFCDVGPTVRMGQPNDPALVHLDKSLPPVFVSHAVSLGDLKEIKKCKGFLWPSFAVTWRVPASFGDVVFLAPATVLPRALDGKRNSPFYLAPTDIWSPTAKELGKRQVEITKQLRGKSDRRHQNDLLISSSTKPSWDNLVGHYSYFGAQDEEKTDKLTQKSSLVSALAGMLQDHSVHPGNPYEYPPRPDWNSQGDYRYPYAELKVIGVVPIQSMVACFYPRKNARRVNAFLDQQGFEGFRVSFGWDGMDRKDYAKHTKSHDEERREWASGVTQAILSWADKPCSGRNVKFGRHVSSQGLLRSSSDYHAVRSWTDRGPSPLSIDRGICGKARS